MGRGSYSGLWMEVGTMSRSAWLIGLVYGVPSPGKHTSLPGTDTNKWFMVVEDMQGK